MSLDDLRKEIDQTDADILKALARRASIVERIRAEKAQSDTPVHDPAREAQLLRRVCQIGAEPLPAASLQAIYREIISACRALQTLRVAYLGPPHTHTHLAALRHFGASAQLANCRSVEDVFSTTERGETQVGVVPIENSLNGVIGETCDCLLQTSLTICAETYLPIHHALLARGEAGAVRTVYSHPQVFAQCREWLRENLPDAEQIAASSTAAAARLAAAADNAGAIAPAGAAEPHGLQVLAENIEDRPDNRTRFFVVGDRETSPTGRDKTSVVFSAAHRAGSLHHALTPLHDHGINMTLIQSRPSRARLWEYVFFVDFEGHVTDRQVQAALDDLQRHCLNLKVLGSYPMAE